jgi:hypothetical protein
MTEQVIAVAFDLLRVGLALALVVCGGGACGLAWETAKDGEFGFALGSLALAAVLFAGAALICVAFDPRQVAEAVSR